MSAEEIMSKVLAEKDDSNSYYAEGIMKVTSNGKTTENISFKEYAGDNGKRKMVSTDLLRQNHQAYAVNDGKQLISFETGSKKAYSMDLTDQEIPTMTHKEQMMTMLEAMKDTHSKKVSGEERVNGFDTYHLKLTAKEKDNLLGDMELWIDQKTWFMVKLTSHVGDEKTEMEYKKIDFSPKFSANTFKLKLPESVKLTPMESEIGTKTGSLADAEKALGKPFLIFKDLTVDKVEIDELKGEVNRTEITVNYMEQNIPALTVSIFPTPEGKGMAIKKGKWTVRGQNAEYEKTINGLMWDEEGLRYSLMILNPDLKMEKVIKMAEQMKLSSEK
ncbi:LolA family protein [Bacillus rubiinfantis]|uniref:LolA family protein n=1 Tax=Bacillus rubiinfantis TaxID=1499680 RepID=UPI0005A68C04|nr:hypothetical protein [Bacillus rubiinfantis]